MQKQQKKKKSKWANARSIGAWSDSLTRFWNHPRRCGQDWPPSSVEDPTLILWSQADEIFTLNGAAQGIHAASLGQVRHCAEPTSQRQTVLLWFSYLGPSRSELVLVRWSQRCRQRIQVISMTIKPLIASSSNIANLLYRATHFPAASNARCLEDLKDVGAFCGCALPSNNDISFPSSQLSFSRHNTSMHARPNYTIYMPDLVD